MNLAIKMEELQQLNKDQAQTINNLTDQLADKSSKSVVQAILDDNHQHAKELMNSTRSLERDQSASFSQKTEQTPTPNKLIAEQEADQEQETQDPAQNDAEAEKQGPELTVTTVN